MFKLVKYCGVLALVVAAVVCWTATEAWAHRRAVVVRPVVRPLVGVAPVVVVTRRAPARVIVAPPRGRSVIVVR